MRYRLLGPLQIRRGGEELRLGGPRQRAVLATLALRANETVSFEHLSEAVWESPPAAPESNIRTYVAALRKLLPEDLVTVPGGYRLDVPPSEVDVGVFDELSARGDEAARAGDHRAAAAAFEEALALWRGSVLEGLAVGPGLQAELSRLEDRRLTVAERHARAMIELGHGDRLIGDLLKLTALAPLREQLWFQLMRALHRAGRTAEALRAFEDLRVLLADELGVDPGPELRELHERLLRGEQPGASLNTLPRDVADFTGRTAEIERLLREVTGKSAVVISAIDGMPGVGKTTLAVHLAHRLAYPDGQLFIDLHAHTAGRSPMEPVDALGVLLRAFGREELPDGLDARATLWRSELSRRRALVVLDNAASAEQVRPLLPGMPGSLVLVTSRSRLVELEGTSTVTLDVLPVAEALVLFASIVGDERGADQAALDVVELCGRLPLAVRLAAGRLRSRPQWTAADLATRLREGRISELDAVFALSFGQLPPSHQQLFGRLGLHVGTDFDLDQAAALGDLDLLATDRMLEELVDVHLLQPTTFGRYRMHDLLRQYAQSTVDSPDAPLSRLFDHFVDMAVDAVQILAPAARRIEIDVAYRPARRLVLRDYDHAMAWLETERLTMVAAVVQAHERGWPHAWQLPRVLAHFFIVRGHVRDNVVTHELALDVAVNDPRTHAVISRNLGVAYWQVARYPEAVEQTQRAIDLYRELGDVEGEAVTLGNLGLLYRNTDRIAESAQVYEEVLRIAREIGSPYVESKALGNISSVYRALGRLDDALVACTESLNLMRKLGDRRDEADTLAGLGLILHDLGRHDEALDTLKTALAQIREIGAVATETVVLNAIGNLLTSIGRREEAVVHLRAALELAERIDDRREIAMAHRLLASVTDDPVEAERHRVLAEEMFAAFSR